MAALKIARKQRLAATIAISFSFFVAELTGLSDERRQVYKFVNDLTVKLQLDSTRTRWHWSQMRSTT